MSVIASPELPQEQLLRMLRAELREMMEKSDPADKTFHELISKCKRELSRAQLSVSRARQVNDPSLESLEEVFNSFTETVGLADSVKISRGSDLIDKTLTLPSKLVAKPKYTAKKKKSRKPAGDDLFIDSISPMHRDKRGANASPPKDQHSTSVKEETFDNFESKLSKDGESTPFDTGISWDNAFSGFDPFESNKIEDVNTFGIDSFGGDPFGMVGNHSVNDQNNNNSTTHQNGGKQMVGGTQVASQYQTIPVDKTQINSQLSNQQQSIIMGGTALFDNTVVRGNNAHQINAAPMSGAGGEWCTFGPGSTVFPAVPTHMGTVQPELMGSTYVQPMTGTVVAPMTGTVVAPMTGTVVAPMTATVVAPMTATVAAPMTATVAAPMTATVAAPMTATVAAPMTAPMTATITPTMVPSQLLGNMQQLPIQTTPPPPPEYTISIKNSVTTALPRPGLGKNPFTYIMVLSIRNMQLQILSDASGHPCSTQSLTKNANAAGNCAWEELLVVSTPPTDSLNDLNCYISFTDATTKIEIASVVIPLKIIEGRNGIRATYNGCCCPPGSSQTYEITFVTTSYFAVKDEVNATSMSAQAVQPSNENSNTMDQRWSSGVANTPSYVANGSNMMGQLNRYTHQTNRYSIPKTQMELQEEIEAQRQKLEALSKANEQLQITSHAAISELHKEKTLNAAIKGELKLLESPQREFALTRAAVQVKDDAETFLDADDVSLYPASLLSKHDSLPPLTKQDWLNATGVSVAALTNWPPKGMTFDDIKLLKSYQQFGALLSSKGGTLYEDEYLKVLFAMKTTGNRFFFRIGVMSLAGTIEGFRSDVFNESITNELQLKPQYLQHSRLRAGDKTQQLGCITVDRFFALPPVIKLSYVTSQGLEESIPLRIPVSFLQMCIPAHVPSKVFFAHWNSPSYAVTSSKIKIPLNARFREYRGSQLIWSCLNAIGAFALLDTIEQGESLVLSSRSPIGKNGNPIFCLMRIDRGSSNETYGFVLIEARCGSPILLESAVATVVSCLVDYEAAYKLRGLYIQSLTSLKSIRM